MPHIVPRFMPMLQSVSRQAIAHVCLSLWILMAIALPTHAGFVNGSYSVAVGESERLLAAEIELERGVIDQMQFNSIVFQETCMNPSIRLHLRNRFAMSIHNDASSQGDLTSVTIDLTSLIPNSTDPALVFGNGDIPTDGFNGSYHITSPYFNDGDGIGEIDGNIADDGVPVTLTTVPDLQDPSRITLNFNGLAPGKAIVFRLDVDKSPDNGAYIDYRHALYGVNVGGTGTTTPAQIQATFTNGGMSTSTGFDPFVSNFTNDQLAALATAAPIEPYHAQSMSGMNGQNGRTDIPEPSTAMLISAGATALLASRRRSARQRRPC